MKRIFEIQQELTVEKSERQSSYTYRTLPATLKAVLPLLGKKGLVMMLPCSSEQRTNGTYVVAMCAIYDVKDNSLVASTTYVTLDQNAMIKGGQGTGAAATYAKKGAIDSMFLLDANNPDLLDLDDHDGLQRVADRVEDAEAKAFEKRVEIVCGLFAEARTEDELKGIKTNNMEVMNDERVKKAALFAYNRITRKQ